MSLPLFLMLSHQSSRVNFYCVVVAYFLALLQGVAAALFSYLLSQIFIPFIREINLNADLIFLTFRD